MKRTLVYTLSVITLAGALVLTGCKKKQAAKNEDAQTTQDNQQVQSNADAAVNDANVAIGDYPKLSGKGETVKYPEIMTNICGASFDTTGLSSGTIKINYSGIVCNNVKREGAIRITIQNHSAGARWKIAGCVAKIEYLDYKLTKASNGKSVKFNGIHYVTNVSGGTLGHIFLNFQPNLVHTISGNDLLVTFDDTKTASWNLSRRYTYTYGSGVFTCKGEGTGTADGLTELENWGTTRDGDAFTSQVSTPVIWNTTCGAWAPIQGVVNLRVDSKEFDLKCTFGVDAGGSQVEVAPNSCAYGWRVDWTYKNKSNKKIIAY